MSASDDAPVSVDHAPADVKAALTGDVLARHELELDVLGRRSVQQAEQVDALFDRVSKLETAVDDLDEQVIALGSSVAATRARVDKLWRSVSHDIPRD